MGIMQWSKICNKFVNVIYFLFFTFIHQGDLKLMKSDRKDISKNVKKKIKKLYIT